MCFVVGVQFVGEVLYIDGEGASCCVQGMGLAMESRFEEGEVLCSMEVVEYDPLGGIAAAARLVEVVGQQRHRKGPGHCVEDHSQARKVAVGMADLYKI